MISGTNLIYIERLRQTTEESWDRGHDDELDEDQLAWAAACYAMPRREWHHPYNVPYNWPFTEEHWKPTPDDRIRELVKAGALIAAEIDRLQREETA